MKPKKEDKILRELFKVKLENVEIAPAATVKKMLMRRIAGMEFFRFNPGRINVWYLGGFLATSIILALIFSSLPGKRADDLKKAASTDTVKVAEADSSFSGRTATAESSLFLSETPETSAPEDVKGDKVERVIPPGNPVIEPEAVKESVNTTPEIIPDLSGKRIITEDEAVKNILRESSRSPDKIIVQSVDSGCTPLKVSFNVNSPDIDSCLWSFGDGGTTKVRDPVWIFDIEGTYKITLSVFRSDNAEEKFTSNITVHPSPSVRFEFSPYKPTIPDEEVRFINYSSGAEKYKWDFGDGTASELFEPVHRYLQGGNYNVILTGYSVNGCIDSLFVRDIFGRSAYFIEFPESFIPNPEGPSDGYYSSKSNGATHIFHPRISGVSDYQLRIFSSEGLLIFESNDVNIGWDGYYDGRLCQPMIYDWKVRGKFVNGEPFTKMGNVSLLKTGF